MILNLGLFAKISTLISAIGIVNLNEDNKKINQTHLIFIRHSFQPSPYKNIFLVIISAEDDAADIAQKHETTDSANLSHNKKNSCKMEI